MQNVSNPLKLDAKALQLKPRRGNSNFSKKFAKLCALKNKQFIANKKQQFFNLQQITQHNSEVQWPPWQKIIIKKKVILNIKKKYFK